MKAIAILFAIIFVFIFAIGSIASSVHAESDEPQVGLKLGQWIEYLPSISIGGDDNMKKFLEPLERKLKDQFQEESGFNIDNAIWVKYTVSDISGTIVTFDRTVKLASDSETRDEFILQSILEVLSPENKIDADVLSNIYEKKLESRQFDLTEFEPGISFVMPTNLEFGSKFEGAPAYGEVTFSSIDDWFRTGTKNNSFTAHKITTQTVRQGVVENTMEFDTIANFYYDRQSGILESKSVDIEITNMNTHDIGWITITVVTLGRSDDLRSTSISKPINDRNEILEKLSYFFVESADSEYLFTNGVESIGEPKRTTFDIIRVSDGYELGSLILYGDDKISLIRSSTLVGGEVKPLESDRIHGLLVLSFEPSCEIFVPDHYDLLLENTDKGNAFAETTCTDIHVKRSWTETDPGLKMGVFAQEITFLDEDIVDQNNTPKQVVEEETRGDLMNDVVIEDGGGCLIATATFGSELATQVQQLREIRDNSLLQTESGSAFMKSFNQFYYSFSPEIADLERENPMFKETVKLAITPLITSLSILNYVDMNSEVEVLGYGISLILLNVGMYFVLPAIVIHRVRKFV